MRFRRKASTSSRRNTQLFPIFVPGSSPERAYWAIVSGSALNNIATPCRSSVSSAVSMAGTPKDGIDMIMPLKGVFNFTTIKE